MKVLVLNCGSSSVKFQLIQTDPDLIARDQDRQLARGAIDKIGTEEAIVTYDVPGGVSTKFSREILDHAGAIKAAIGCLTDKYMGAVEKPQDIDAVGHRIVHGGERFSKSVEMSAEVVSQIEESIELAPLHNPHNLKGYYASRAQLPHAAHVAVFDTAFHQTLTPEAFLYGLPYPLYLRYKIRRYGFHGTSHRYVSYRYAQLHGTTREAFKLITCHLGNGCSICAIDRGKSVDTSMGFTPLEGLIMGTRCGDVDPSVILYVMAQEGLTVNEAGNLLNKHSGLYGLSGISNDMRTLIGQSNAGDQRARLAIDVFCYRIRKYIGAYIAAMNGVDGIILTGGIGENSPLVRQKSLQSLDTFGIAVDEKKNASAIGVEKDITAESSRVKIYVIPTNEELLIARDTVRCILNIPH